jgi:hypothetical protein
MKNDIEDYVARTDSNEHSKPTKNRVGISQQAL